MSPTFELHCTSSQELFLLFLNCIALHSVFYLLFYFWTAVCIRTASQSKWLDCNCSNILNCTMLHCNCNCIMLRCNCKCFLCNQECAESVHWISVRVICAEEKTALYSRDQCKDLSLELHGPMYNDLYHMCFVHCTYLIYTMRVHGSIRRVNEVHGSITCVLYTVSLCSVV